MKEDRKKRICENISKSIELWKKQNGYGFSDIAHRELVQTIFHYLKMDNEFRETRDINTGGIRLFAPSPECEKCESDYVDKTYVISGGLELLYCKCGECGYGWKMHVREKDFELKKRYELKDITEKEMKKTDVIRFKPKVLKMRVDDDSPFKGRKI